MNLKEYIQHRKGEFDSEKISENSSQLFSEILKKELHPVKKAKVKQLQIVGVAASIVLVVSVLFWVQKNNLSEETKEVLAYLNNDSAGTRLEGVYKFDEEFNIEDSRIINALLTILHKDANTNVKIATIDALLKFPTNEKIRTGLIAALEEETIPLVQIKLIKSLSFLRENRAQKPLEKIINNKQTFPIVKNNATLAINQLKQ